MAGITLDDQCKENLVSRAFVERRLGLEIRKMSEADEKLQVRAKKSDQRIKGWVELKWGMNRDENTIYATKFLVANTRDFDLILGSQSISEHEKIANKLARQSSDLSSSKISKDSFSSKAPSAVS